MRLLFSFVRNKRENEIHVEVNMLDEDKMQTQGFVSTTDSRVYKTSGGLRCRIIVFNRTAFTYSSLNFEKADSGAVNTSEIKTFEENYWA